VLEHPGFVAFYSAQNRAVELTSRYVTHGLV